MVQKMKLFQIVIDKDLSKLINKEGWDCHVKAKAKILSMEGNPSIGIQHKCYSHVANIIADDLEHAFEAGNIGPADRVEKIAPKMTSVSVGDIIEDDTGTWMCDSFGWKEVTWDQYNTL